MNKTTIDLPLYWITDHPDRELIEIECKLDAWGEETVRITYKEFDRLISEIFRARADHGGAFERQLKIAKSRYHPNDWRLRGITTSAGRAADAEAPTR